MTPTSEVALKAVLVEMLRVLAILSARTENGPQTADLAAALAIYLEDDPCAPGTDDLREAGA